MYHNKADWGEGRKYAWSGAGTSANCCQLPYNIQDTRYFLLSRVYSFIVLWLIRRDSLDRFLPDSVKAGAETASTTVRGVFGLPTNELHSSLTGDSIPIQSSITKILTFDQESNEELMTLLLDVLSVVPLINFWLVAGVNITPSLVAANLHNQWIPYKVLASFLYRNVAITVSCI